MKKFLFAILVLGIAASACKKTEEVVIDGNQAPPDSTISEVVIQNYVNKAYISVLGRKPDDNEKAEGIALLEQNHLAQADREAFIDIVLNKPTYNEQLVKLASYDLLESFDTAAVTQQIILFQYLLTDSAYQYVWSVLQYEIGRLQDLKAVLPDIEAENLDVPGMHRRLINNYFYDQLHMGTENFVKATFENFLFRDPTASELAQASQMVDGFNSVVFLQSGSSKDDFMDIFFQSHGYYEGQIRYLFLKYLFREPTSEEMAAYTSLYKNSGSYKLLQKTILTFDEYVGLD